jgi:transcriptional regulator with XRE-family HTH domain
LLVSPVEDGEDRRRSVSMLTRIAAALDVPEKAFSKDRPPETEFDNTIELLRIWHDLEHAADRRKLLAYAQALAAGRR